MSDQKTPIPTLKRITSKIDTGLVKKPSTVVLLQARQPSQLSNVSSRQSQLNLLGRQPSSTSTTAPRNRRPSTSSSTLRLSQSSKLDISDSKLQKLGRLPPFLLKKRPATAVDSCLKMTKPSEAEETVDAKVNEQKKDNAKLKDVLDWIAEIPVKNKGEKTAEVTEVIQLAEAVNKVYQPVDQSTCPPCEGAGDTQGDGWEQQKRIFELEADIAAKVEVIKERDSDVEQLKLTLENLQTISTSREALSRNGLQELEAKISDLQANANQKCKDLIKRANQITVLENRVKELTKQLAEAGSTLEEKQNRIAELTAKLADMDSLKDRLGRSEKARRNSEEHAERLQREMDHLKEEICKRDEQTAELQTFVAVEPIRAELEAQKAEVNNLRAEVNRLQFENDLMVNVKQQDDVLLEIRDALLESVECDKETLAEALSRIQEGDGEIGTTQERKDAFERVFKTLLDNRGIEQNNQKSENMWSRLLGKLRTLQQDMREIVANSGL